MYAFLQEVSGLWLTNVGRIRGSTRHEAQGPGMRKLRAVIRAKDGNLRGIDGPIGRIRSWALAVLFIHPITNDGLVEGTGSAQHLLLSFSPVQEAPAGMDTVGEIQGKRAQASLNEAS